MLDPQTQAVLEVLTSSPAPWDFDDPVAARAVVDAGIVAATGSDGVATRDLEIPGPAGDLRVRVYEPPGEGPNPVLVYFHGGGWVICGIESHDATVRELVRRSGVSAVSVDYRLAPEHPFPAAVDDCYAATRWVAEHAASLGTDASRLAVGGDSAGGNLAAAVALRSRDAGGPAIAFQLLVYPVTDLPTAGHPSYEENATGYHLTRRAMEWFWDRYLSTDEDRSNPYAVPMRAADLSGLPPAAVITAEHDPLRDEGEAYARGLEAAGVQVRLTRYPGQIHGFFSMFEVIDAARSAQEEAATALRVALRPRQPGQP